MGRGFTWNTFSPWGWREARGQMCMEVTDQEGEESAWWPAWSPWQEAGGEFLICHEGGEGICESGGSGRKETVQNLMSKDLEERSVAGRVELKYSLQGFNVPRHFPTLPSYCRKAPDLRQGSQVRSEWFLAGSIRTISSLSPWPLTFPCHLEDSLNECSDARGHIFLKKQYLSHNSSQVSVTKRCLLHLLPQEHGKPSWVQEARVFTCMQGEGHLWLIPFWCFRRRRGGWRWWGRVGQYGQGPRAQGAGTDGVGSSPCPEAHEREEQPVDAVQQATGLPGRNSPRGRIPVVPTLLSSFWQLWCCRKSFCLWAVAQLIKRDVRAQTQ